MNGDLCTLDELYGELFRRYSDDTAIKFRNRTTTYAELDDQSAKLANAFRTLGLHESDRVAILIQNRPEFIVTEIAAARANVTTVPLNSKLSDKECRYALEDADPDVLVVGPTFFETVQELQQESLDCRHVIGLGDDRDLPIGFHSFETLLEKAAANVPPVQSDEEDVATIFYTGGTTGEQKGTLHSHGSIVLNLYSHVYELEVGKRETGLLLTPLSHSAGYFAKTILMQGGTIVLKQGFEPSDMLQCIETEGVSWLYLIPAMISELLDQSDVANADTSSLETLVYGSAPLPESRIEESLEAFGDVFIQFYGLTEVPNLVTVLPKSKHLTDQDEWLRSNGVPAQLAEIELREFGNQWDDWDDDIGEITVRAPYAMEGYLDREPNTSRHDEEWIRTGDIGRIDSGGRLHILDRIQDVIISDDRLIYSTEVEGVIQRHPDIREVAVIGIPKNTESSVSPAEYHEIEQEVKAVISLDDGEMLELERMQEFCKDKLPEPAIPDSIDKIGTLPQTPYGKVDKKLLRDPYW